METFQRRRSKGGKHPDRPRSGAEKRRVVSNGVDIAAVLPEQRDLWFRAAALDDRSFSSWARKTLDAAAESQVRDSRQHQAAEAGA